jgi:hypothetical protein
MTAPGHSHPERQDVRSLRFRSSPKPDVKRRTQHRMRREKEARSLGSTQVVARDLLNEVDDASP